MNASALAGRDMEALRMRILLLGPAATRGEYKRGFGMRFGRAVMRSTFREQSYLIPWNLNGALGIVKSM